MAIKTIDPQVQKNTKTKPASAVSKVLAKPVLPLDQIVVGDCVVSLNAVPDGAIDLTLAPRLDRHSRTNAVVLRTEVHQVFGTWSGTVRAEDGRELRLEGAQGFAEEARNTW